MADVERRRVAGETDDESGSDVLPTADTVRVTARLEAELRKLDAEPDAAAASAANALRDALATIRTLRDDAESVRQRYVGLINAVPDAVTLMDLEGNVLEANDAACRIYGRPHQVLTRLGVADLNPDIAGDRMAEVNRTYRIGDVFTVETMNVRGDGQRFPVEVHSAVFLDRGERRVIAVARDITLRRAAEAGLRASERRYRQLLQAMDKGILVQDERGRVLSANAAACRILGFDEAELQDPANRFERWHVVDEHGKALALAGMPGMRALRERQTISSTLLGVYNRERRRYAWLAVTAVPFFRDGDDAPFQVISTFGDVTELKRDSELFAQTQALAHIGGWDLDHAHGAMYWTDELHRILEREPGGPVDLETLLGHVAVGDRARVRSSFAEVRREGGSFDVECRLLTARGNQRWARLLGSGQVREGVPFRTAGTLQDVTAGKLHEEELRRQALTDPLTGLANRDAALEQLNRALARADANPVVDSDMGATVTGPAILYVDLDRFKVINDLLGHSAGDRLLAAAAQRLREAVGGDALLARFGGDEFLALLNGEGNLDQAGALAERICTAFRAPFRFGDDEFGITASVGVACHPQHGGTAQMLLQSADAAVTDAKRRGRNTWEAFNPSLAQQLSDRLLVETQLRRALENNEFRLVYQPQVVLDGGRVRSVEALIRWRNRLLGEMRPDRFIGHAETTGDIVRIGAWVIREACRQMRVWRDAGLGLERVAVNVSFRQFLSEDLADIVVAALSEFELPGHALELEITERVLIEDAPDTMDTFEALKKLGVVMTIDDFGEGYSALNYLRRLPIDCVKISHSFMQGVPENASDVAICQAIVGIAHSLGLGVVAEGIEREEQRQFLTGLGIELGQGFLFSEARPPGELTAMLRQRGH